MQKFMGDSRGVSVVVGAIMLTLIVVTAATTYAIFLSDQQKKVQDAETVKLQRELENITILSLENPIYNSPTLHKVSFIIVNMNTEKSTFTSMNINNRFIRQFTFKWSSDSSVEEWNQSSGKFQIGCLYANETAGTAWNGSYLFIDRNNNQIYDTGEEVLDYNYDKGVNGPNAVPKQDDRGGLLTNDSSGKHFIFQDLNKNSKYDAGDTIIHSNPSGQGNATTDLDKYFGSRFFVDYTKRPTILPREQITLIISNTKTDTIGAKDITKDDSITLHIFTSLTNDFVKTFYPPTAIITIITESQWDPTASPPAYKPVLILDGSQSDHPGDGQILQWQWDFAGAFPTQSGRKVRAPDGINSGGPYTITLTVTDIFGMSGSASIQYP